MQESGCSPEPGCRKQESGCGPDACLIPGTLPKTESESCFPRCSLLRFERSNQTVQHSPNFLGVSDQHVGLIRWNDLNSGAEFELRLEFRARAMRSPEMLDVVSRR